MAEARDHHAPPAVMAAARQMASDLQRTKHEAEDVLVAFVLDCNRCGRRVHWVPGEGCKLGHWAHAEPARQRIIDPSSGDMTLAWIGVSSPDARERLSMW